MIGLVWLGGHAPAHAADPALADVVAQVRDSVVTLTMYKDAPKIEAAATPAPAEPANPAPPVPKPAPLSKIGFGAGFIIEPSGVVVTNKHVLTDALGFMVTTRDGTVLRAHVLGVAAHSDIALLQIEGGGTWPAVAFADSDAVREGDAVFTIGNPLGLSSSLSAGVISALDRASPSGEPDRYLQTDAAVNRGNSGGPLFDAKGGVIGVTSALQSAGEEGGSIGLGFALAANDAQFAVTRLLRQGSVRSGWIGVVGQEMTPSLAAGVGLAGRRGVIITRLAAESPGYRAGLRVGDVVLKFGAHDISTLRGFQTAVSRQEAGSMAELVVWRDDQEVTGSIRVLDWPEEVGSDVEKIMGTAKPVRAISPSLGMTLVAIGTDNAPAFSLAPYAAGVVVSAVAHDSDAAVEGLRPGDVIVKVGLQPVATPAEVWRAIDQAMKSKHDRVLLLVTNEKELKFVALPLLR